VLGSEHYFEHVRQMHCAAAQIRDIHGALAGVLDISSESVEFGFDAGVVVGHLACAIENRLLLSQSPDHLVLRVQVAPPWLDTSSVGLVGIRLDGRVAWVNGVASRLLGLPAIDRSRELPLAESVLGASFGQLASLTCDPARLLALPNGLSLWVRPDLRSLRSIAITLPMPQPCPPTSAPTPACPVTPAEAAEPAASGASTACRPETGPEHRQTVATTHLELLQRTLQAQGGNVSMTARALGVSRGWVYRRMQGARLQAGQSKPDSGGH
jgi:transcriptional regulator of acetoin/glycerol metabolism